MLEESLNTINSIVYYNHKFLPLHKVKIHPLDKGFIAGDSITINIVAYYGKPLALTESLFYLQNILSKLCINLSVDISTWHLIIKQLITKNNYQHQYLKILITRGLKEQTVESPPTILITSQPISLPAINLAYQGLKATVVSDLLGKNIQLYINNDLARRVMHQSLQASNFDEAIILNNGYAIEGLYNELFIVKHKTLIAPLLINDFQTKLVREIMLEIAEKLGISYKLSKITERDLLKADEIYLASALTGILPVSKLNDEQSTRCFSSLGERLFNSFLEYIKQQNYEETFSKSKVKIPV